MISLLRQSYARVFDQAVDTQSSPMSKVSASVYDKRIMAALSVGQGKSTFYTNQMAQNTSLNLEFPSLWDPDRPLYVAILTTGPLVISKLDASILSGEFAVIATDSDVEGQHYGLWTIQERDIQSISVAVPSTANGGFDCEIKVFMYEIPDLTIATSYVDNVVALGVTGS